MLDPAELLAVARLLTAKGAAPPPNEAQLRRAISTAYYSLFHSALRVAADRFLGVSKRDKPAYGLIYRGFNHGRMKQICREIDKPKLKDQFN